MGIQGLRRFLDSSVPAVQLSKEKSYSVDHVAIDLNCLIYQAYSSHHRDAVETIQVLLRLLDQLLSVLKPSVTLIVAMDGPAPIAKLLTQRQRRRKLQFSDTANNQGHSELSITAGSPFLLQVEDALATWMKLQLRQGKFRQAIIAGGATAGEGEAKLSRILFTLCSLSHSNEAPKSVTKHPGHHHPHPSQRGKPSATEVAPELLTPVGPTDSIVIVGNDIDLGLSALGFTPSLNIGVVSPAALQLYDISGMFGKWLGNEQGFLPSFELLPSARVDFVFLFNLNGGDHYVGLGEAASDLWKRYRLAKKRNPEGYIVSEDLLSLNTSFLGDVLGSKAYSGSADPQIGQQLLLAALWATRTTCTGSCPDYRFTADTLAEVPGGPTHAHLHSAIQRLGTQGLSLTPSTAAPLAPLANFVALLPAPGATLRALDPILKKNAQLAQELAQGKTAKDLCKAAEKIVKLLAPAEAGPAAAPPPSAKSSAQTQGLSEKEKQLLKFKPLQCFTAKGTAMDQFRLLSDEKLTALLCQLQSGGDWLQLFENPAPSSSSTSKQDTMKQAPKLRSDPLLVRSPFFQEPRRLHLKGGVGVGAASEDTELKVKATTSSNPGSNGKGAGRKTQRGDEEDVTIHETEAPNGRPTKKPKTENSHISMNLDV